MTTAEGPKMPLVSMIVPVYNSVSYLAETLDSMLDQGLSEAELEVITVDDGSDDGSEVMLDQYAERYSNFRVIHQANSGGPASPCNVGLEAARGRYFFVLGSDDVMTPNALRDLATVAERAGSDVVLGKLGSIGGRRTPGRVFEKTVYNADLVEDYLFNTLSAIKLFRTSLVHQTGARFPTTMRIGEDQPFVATLYLAARKISICADRDYVRIRTRDDGTNITAQKRKPSEYMDLLNLLIPVIVAGTEPGDVRDGVMRRPFRNSLTKSLRVNFLKEDQDTQRRLIKDIRSTIGPVYSSAAAAHLDPLPRTKVELALDGDLKTLRLLLDWEKSGKSARVVHDGLRFAYNLPGDLEKRLGQERVYSPVVRGDVVLAHVSCLGAVIDLDFTALVSDCKTPARETLLRMRNRETGDEVEVSTETQRQVTQGAGSGHESRARLDMSEFPRGVWDAYVVQHFGEDEVVTRFGAKKVEGVPEKPAYLFAGGEDLHALGKLYYTRGPGNLSVDIGFNLTKNELPEVAARGVVQVGAGEELLLVHVLNEDAIEFFVTESEDSWVKAPHVALDGNLHAVSLPAGLPPHGTDRWLLVRSSGEERKIPLPESSSLRGAEASDTARVRSARHEGEHTADIFRGAVRDLCVVGRRSVRRAGREAKRLVRRVSGAPGRNER